MSTSPRFSAAARVVSSGTLFSTRRFTLRHLALVALEGLERQVDALVLTDVPVRALRRWAPSRKALVADLLDESSWYHQPAPVADVP